MSIIVTGGAGYIGAHVVDLLIARGESVIVVDDLVTGSSDRVGTVPIVVLDVSEQGSSEALAELMTNEGVTAVIHLAARKQVAESVERPAWYHRQNVTGLSNLLSAMREAGVEQLVFSSSAAVYGDSDGIIGEDAPLRPINPYGQTKMLGEGLISVASEEWGLRAVSLRYFNVGGAVRPELADRQALNLIPIVLDRLAAGEPPVIFGDDYPTVDGTCVRDYVHVSDVASAHLVMLDALAQSRGHSVFNIGTGVGTSVRELVTSLLAASGSSVVPVVQGRRPGDAPTVVADVSRVRESTDWVARHTLDDIVSSAWESRRYLDTGSRGRLR